MWRLILVAAVAALLLGLLLASSAFPPGADPGLMLTLSYALSGAGPEGELAYAPALPALMLVARRIAADDTSLIFVIVKVLGVLFLVAEAAGLAAFAGALAGRRAFMWTFVLAVWNPSSWNQLLWGGYAQMLGIGLGGCALALLVRERYLAAGVALGAVVLTHPYSAFFFLVAASVLSLARRSWRAFVAAPIAALVALPAVPAYSHLLGELSFGGSTEGYTIALAEVFQNILYHPVINVLMGVVLAFAFAARKGVVRRIWPFLVACALLVVVTPPLNVARAGLFCWHGAVLFMGLSFAATGVVSRYVFALVGLMPIVSFVELTTLIDDYAPLEAQHAGEMAKLADAADGRALIVSPHPNVDGWWYEGLTGKPALIGDHLRWALLREQRERSVAARIIEHATSVRHREPFYFLTRELPAERDVTTLWVRDVEFFPLIEMEPVVRPAPGARCDEPDGTLMRCEFLYDWFRLKGFTREIDIAALSAEPTRYESVKGLLAKWDVTHVWIRDTPEAVERFALDESFEKLWEADDVIVFRYRG